MTDLLIRENEPSMVLFSNRCLFLVPALLPAVNSTRHKEGKKSTPGTAAVNAGKRQEGEPDRDTEEQELSRQMAAA